MTKADNFKGKISHHHTNLEPANIFCSENAVCLLHLLHIFKCTPEHFYHGSKQYEFLLEQSDPDPYCLQDRLPKYIGR